MNAPHQSITPDRFDAVLFDLDGVLTSTAKIHGKCWKTMFDDFLRHRASEKKEPFQPFDIDTDYKRYVDGKLRYEGVRSFLASRDIALTEGTPEDLPTADTVCGLGNRKDELVEAAIDQGQVEAYPGSVALVRRLREQGIRTGVVSSSNNLPPRRTVGPAAGATGSPALTKHRQPTGPASDTRAYIKQTSEVRDVISFAKTVPHSAWRHTLDGISSTHGKEGSGTERERRTQRPPNRRTLAEELFLRPCLHQPVTACHKDL